MDITLKPQCLYLSVYTVTLKATVDGRWYSVICAEDIQSISIFSLWLEVLPSVA